MPFLREPLIAFSVVFLFSMAAAFMLFKILASHAAIRGKGWQAGGAIAGFLLVFFPSWYSLKPMLPMERQPYISPLNVPSGFKPYTSLSPPFSLAVPHKWVQVGQTVSLIFSSPDQKDNELFVIMIHDDFPSDAFNEHDIQDLLTQYGAVMSQIFNPNSIDVGKGEFSSYEGLRCYVAHGVTHFEEGRAMKTVFQCIWDHRSRRLYYMMYSDSPTGKQIASTLNIQ